MKKADKYIIIFFVIAFLFSVSTTAYIFHSLSVVRDTSNKAVASIVSKVVSDYPELDVKEIVEIINSEQYDESCIEIFDSYGIDIQEEWLVYENEEESLKLITGALIINSIFSLALFVVFLFYNRSRKKQTKIITECIRQINKGDYTLVAENYSEDELSLLNDEIYKTAVMLREQAENSNKDRINLKDSLSDISHQLKTPLTSVIVMLDNMLDDDEMPVEIRRQFMWSMKRQTNNISFLVKSILTLSKLDANTVAFKKSDVSISEIISECVENTEVLAEINEVEVKAEVDSEFDINCDRKWLCEALTNIIKNCIEHTSPEGWVKIKAEKNKIYALISIEDNGCGIAPEDLPHIFKRFYKGKNSDDNSVGIGLALAKTIIEKDDGYITVDSEVGKGTRFEIKYFNNPIK